MAALNAQRFGLALGITMMLAYVVCALLVAFMPEVAERFSQAMMQDMMKVRLHLVGIIAVFLYGYAFGWFLAFIYNRLAK